MHTFWSIEQAHATVIRAQSVSAGLRIRMKRLKEATTQSRTRAERLRGEVEERVLRTETRMSSSG
jgi:hypothetical protein